MGVFETFVVAGGDTVDDILSAYLHITPVENRFILTSSQP